MSIKENLKSNKCIYGFYRKAHDFYENKFRRSHIYWLAYKNPAFWIKYFFRKIGIGGKKYKRLQKFHNCESGRCFIVATGPSLTMEDLQKLKNEKTFGMNSLCKVFPELGWETTYYGIQDYGVFYNLQEDLQKMKDTILFYADQKFKKKEIQRLSCENYVFPRYYGNHLYNRKNLKTGFSDDISLIVHEGYTIAYVMLQIAAYMGFKEIYLIGTDCNYSKNIEKQHFTNSGYYASNYKTIGNEMIFAYSVAKKNLDKKGIKVYNATRGGMLEVFPRVDLDDILHK